MEKCTKDPQGKIWHKSKKEAVVCGCYMKKANPEIEIKAEIPKEPDKIVEKIKEKVKEITKVEDDKIDDSDVITEVSPDEDDSPRQDSSIFIVILIIIALVAGIVIFFADEIKGIIGGSDE